MKTGKIGGVTKKREEGRVIEKGMPEFYDVMVQNVAGEKNTLLITENLYLLQLISKDFKING